VRSGALTATPDNAQARENPTSREMGLCFPVTGEAIGGFPRTDQRCAALPSLATPMPRESLIARYG
jgi:hypothetical protein